MALPQAVFFGVDLVKFGIDFVNFYALYFAISLTLNLEAGYTRVPHFGQVLYFAGRPAVSGSLCGRTRPHIFGRSTQFGYDPPTARRITQAKNRITSEPAT